MVLDSLSHLLIFIDMLYYDVLDEVAEQVIPNNTHPELHVNPRKVWVEIMIQLIEHKAVKTGYHDLYHYASMWESLLYKRFSSLN